MTKTLKLSGLMILFGCMSEPATEAFPTAFARNGCGPADGPAVQLSLSPITQVEPVEPPVFRIGLWRSRAELAGKTWTVAPASLTNGFASYCSGPNDCEEAVSGTVRLDPVADPAVQSGEVDLTFRKRGAVRATFRAAWRDVQILCG